jgi:hypothetical protein
MAVKFVNSIIIILKINGLRGRYFHGRTIRMCRCLTVNAFCEGWMLDHDRIHASANFTNMLIRPSKYNKICRTAGLEIEIWKINIVIETANYNTQLTQFRSLIYRKDQVQK